MILRCSIAWLFTKHIQAVSFINLWGQVELHVTIIRVFKLIFHHEGRVRSESQLHSAAQRSSLCKGHKVSQSKGSSDTLVHRQRRPLLWLFRLPRLQHDIPSAHIALHAEANAILTCLDLHGLAKLLQVPTNLEELSRGQLRNDFILLLRDL